MAKNKRLDAIVNLIDQTDTLVDVGCDHGLTIKKAFERDLLKRAIALDIRPKPLKQAEKNLKKYGVDFVLSDGFKQLNKPFNTAVIAGMGSQTIVDILKDAKHMDATFILQPNDKEHILRSYLNDHDFKIIDETVVFDKYYYVILKVVQGKMNLSLADIYLGPVLIKKQEAQKYYQHKIKGLTKIMNQADEHRQETVKDLIDIYKKGIDQKE